MINVKNLTIGSHVSVDGKRVRVCGITKRKIGYHHPDSRPDAHLRYARIHDVEPIPLTTALLEELGFEWRESAGSWCISDKKDGYFYATICSDSTCIVTHYPNFGFQSRVVCTYLHELEAFAYLIAKTELIKD